MQATIRFRDHEEFQRAALHMGIAGVLAGLAAHVATQLIPGAGPTWILTALMAATAYGASRPANRTRLADLALVALVALGAGGLFALSASIGRADNLGIAAVALGFGLLVGRGGRRFAATLASAGAALLLSRYVHDNLVNAAVTAHIPMWVAAGATGGAFAFVGVLGLLPRHIDIGANRVATAYAASQGIVTGEIRELADRAVALWNKVDATLEPDAPVRKAIEDSVVRLFELARSWSAVEADGARTPIDLLAQRMAAITEKMEKTQDAIAKAQYAQAHAALAEQLRYLKEIGTARERVVARMHHYLAAMERLRFAVINHRSADASRISIEVQPILDDLKDLGSEIDFSSEALGEVDATPRS